jgi:hypothetical protein
MQNLCLGQETTTCVDGRVSACRMKYYIITLAAQRLVSFSHRISYGQIRMRSLLNYLMTTRHTINNIIEIPQLNICLAWVFFNKVIRRRQFSAVLFTGRDLNVTDGSMLSLNLPKFILI